ncbi:MAG: ATP-binding cassette domain-containing protein [Chloroflexi bacterium]|nr:ATP-binding cassette domain-containing protein [Chloroflexota bacterium]
MLASEQSFFEVVNISKRYGGIQALSNINLAIEAGEVIGVVGDTDSGKSTLLRLIAGALAPDSGRFLIDGRRVRLSPASQARRYGIKVVYQDINIAEHMSGLSYIFAGQPVYRYAPLRWIGWWNWRHMRQRALAEFERLGFQPPPLTCRLHDLTSTQRKRIAFVHATISRPRLLLLDEPMNALEADRGIVFNLVDDVRQRGGSVLVVTQNLDDTFAMVDRIVVLNAGHKIAERQTAATTEEEIVRLILGSSDEKLTPATWALANYFEVRRQAEELDRLNKTLERRAIQLQTQADVARSITSILDRDELLSQIVKIIGQRYGYYHTAIFLLDPENNHLVLRNYANRHLPDFRPAETRLPIDETSLVGWCAATGQLQLANDITQSAVYKPEAALAATQAQVALPLRVGHRSLGVLDLQSDRADAFDTEDLFTLQALADQLAIAIRNADLYEAAHVARQQADAANRSKSMFLSNMSHELRTPLSAIIGHTQAMLSQDQHFYSSAIPAEYEHDLNVIRRSGEHLLALINDLLDLSRIEAGSLKLNLEAIDLNSILDYTVRTAETLIHNRPLDLCADYPDDLPPAWGDYVRTQQIILNLLSNASKFTERGEIKVCAAVQDGQIVISVSDTGVGISDTMLDKIFDRFTRGDERHAKRYSGAGLGLSISRQLVELQGGEMRVSSEVGVGSVFSFSLPQATREQLALSGGVPVDSSLLQAKHAVIFDAAETPGTASMPRLALLAQNDEQRAAQLRQALETAGFVVESTGLGQLVVEMADIMMPDVIIVDASEPRGVDVLHQLLAADFAATIPLVGLHTADQVPEPVPHTLPEGVPSGVHYIKWLPGSAEAVVQAIQAVG